MARRIFISHQHGDRNRAKGFNLLRWNQNVPVEFVGRHLLDPVDSKNDAYIRSKVREQLKGTSVTVVLLGAKTSESDWVRWEVEESVAKGNGILAIRLDPDAPLPIGAPVSAALSDAGAEIIDWKPAVFADAIERAARAAGRAQAIKRALDDGPSTGSGCSR